MVHQEAGMEEVLLVAAVIGGIAWWMHGGTTQAQGQPARAAATPQEDGSPQTWRWPVALADETDR